MKKLWPQQVGEEKQAAKKKKKSCVATFPDYVATKPKESQKLFRDKVLLCRYKARRKLCRNKVLCRDIAKNKAKTIFVAAKFFYIAIKPVDKPENLLR